MGGGCISVEVIRPQRGDVMSSRDKNKMDG